MMRKSAHSSQSGALLPSALRCRADEDADVFAVVAASLPLLAGLVPEGFPLGGEVAVAGGDAEEEGVVFFELVRGDEGDGAGLARRVHLREDFFGKGLFDSVFDCSAFGELLVHERRESSVFFAQVHVLEIASADSLIDIGFASGGFNASFLGFGNLCNVAVHGILGGIGQ